MGDIKIKAAISVQSASPLPTRPVEPIHDAQPEDNSLPWAFTTDQVLSPSLQAQVKNVKAPEAKVLWQTVAPEIRYALTLSPQSSPIYQEIAAALALALKDKHIPASEALELRGMMLQLPKAERGQFSTLIARLPLSDEARPILQQIDPDLKAYAKDFTTAEIKLLDSQAFKTVFPNFVRLSMFNQRQVMTELQVFIKHFPDLLNKLANVPNPHYGPGFQFFFLDPESNAEFDHVIAKGMAGIVMPGPGIVKDPLLGAIVKPIALRQLDRGGLYESAISYGTFTHEFGHVIHLHMLHDDHRDAIKNLYDKAWEQLKATDGKHGFVTEYAKTNPYEYFAEGVEYFLTGSAATLKERDPKLHQFLETLLAPHTRYDGQNGNLLTDPERIHLVTSVQNGRVIGGVSVSRESDLVSIKHFEGSTTTEAMALGGEHTALLRGSVGIKASWKPWTKPAGFYATVGGVAQAGMLDQKLSLGAGGFAGAGVDYKFLNAEVRQNFMVGKNAPSSTEVRLGVRFEF